ncbi:MAG TPA: hypothetical protein VF452_03900 [Candidatus Binatia bacterium]
MKRIASLTSAIIISGTLAGVAAADDEVIVRQQIGDNYCHTVIETPRSEGSGTSDWRSSETETVDLYGPCDEPSIAHDQAMKQQQVEYFRFGRDYES